MCELCAAAIKKYWPDLSEEEWNALLWNATAFPAGSGEHVAKQIKEMAERSGTNLGKALALADEDLDKAMAQYKAKMNETSGEAREK